MKAKFICHRDFARVTPVNLFHKELQKPALPEHDGNLFNKHILFRRMFDCKKPKIARLRITADDYYKLYINGKFVCMGPAPGYPWHYNYNTVDVTEYLFDGENTIAVHAYYQGLVNRVWVSGDMRQMLWLELECDGKNVVVSDENWLCAYHSGYTHLDVVGYDTGFNEKYDSNSPEEGFEKCGYDCSDWDNAAVCAWADYTLCNQPTPPVDVYDDEPQQIENSGEIAIDFGKERVGYLHISANGNRGDEVTVLYGEELLNGEIRSDMRCNCHYEDKWILSGGSDEFKPYDYKAFRYAKIIAPKSVKINRICMKVRHFPYEEKYLPIETDENLNRILRLCADTVKYGTQENFVDCPTREKGQYLGDIMISGRAQAILTQNTTFLKKAIGDFFNSSAVCRGLMAVSCCSHMQEIADYSLEIASLVRWVYDFDRDEEFLRYAEPYLTGVCEYFTRYENESGLLDGVSEKWNLVDWPANYRDGYDFPLEIPIGKGVHNVINALWFGFLRDLNKIYRILGKPITEKESRVKKSYNDAFFDKKTHLYCDSFGSKHSSVHSNIFALLFDLYPDKQTENELVQFIFDKKLNSVGVYVAYFALAAIKKSAGVGACKQLILDENCWLKMLSEGATTTYEAWSKDEKWNTSLFHPWAVAPIIILSDCAPY